VDPSLAGLQDTVLQQNMSFDVPRSDFVQFFHMGNCHWVTASNIGLEDPNAVAIYDSLREPISEGTRTLMTQFLHRDPHDVEVKVMAVDRQLNGYDCGVYAIAFATSLVYGQEPTQLKFEPGMRKHLADCIDAGSITPFPSRVMFRHPRVLHQKVTSITSM